MLLKWGLSFAKGFSSLRIIQWLARFVVGLIAAVELVADRDTKEPFEAVGRLGRYLSSQAQERGMINRVMDDALAFCPPLISTEKDINEILGVFGASLDATEHWYLKHTAQY